MDFMKWINSLDEFLYEVMSWLLFFPLTLWRAVIRPLQTMETVRAQAALPDEQQYAELLSPPLFLTLGLLLAMGFDRARAAGPDRCRRHGCHRSSTMQRPRSSCE